MLLGHSRGNPQGSCLRLAAGSIPVNHSIVDDEYEARQDTEYEEKHEPGT
jgi:hypothetical protein